MDLELAQPSQKIIQIGACVGDTITGEIIEKLSVFVNPQEELSEYIIKLTGITQDQVDQGVTLKEAYLRLKDLHTRNQCLMNCVTWGGDDMSCLRSQLEAENGPLSDWPFGRRIFDTKTLFQTYQIANERKVQGGLARSLTKVGLSFLGRKHDGLDDSVNTFHMFKNMLDRLKDDGSEL